MRRKIVFRVDASPAIGVGHLMRCLTLADALTARGANCSFVCAQDALTELVRKKGYKVAEIERPLGLAPKSAAANEAATLPVNAAWLSTDGATDAALTQAVFGERADWVVVDHYGLDRVWECAIRQACDRVMVVDDLADRVHDCDLLVDPGIEPDLSRRYFALTPDHSINLVGPRFAILRPQFDVFREMSSERPRHTIPRRIVVLFGGSDREGHTIEALRVLEEIAPPIVMVEVIISATNQSSAQIVAFCERRLHWVVHIAVDDVAPILARADLAVGSGGSATYERLYLRLPSILKVIAENQRAPLTHMQLEGIIDLYESRDQLATKLATAFSQGVETPHEIVRNGVPAICDAVLSQAVTLQTPQPLDVRRTYRWLQDEDLRRQFVMIKRPEMRTHFAYWKQLLSNEPQKVYSIYSGSVHVGNAGIKNFSHDDDSAELWLYIGDKIWRGRGLGDSALRLLEGEIVRKLGRGRAVLHVLASNDAGMNLYRRSGYLVRNLKGTETSQWPEGIVALEKTL